MKIAIVAMYGLFEKTNKEYADYLRFVAEDANQKAVELIVLCGGKTNKDKPELSEAESAIEEIKRWTKIKIELETESLSTNQNIEFAKRKFSSESKNEYLVYGDRIRRAKIIWIAMRLLLGSDTETIYKKSIEYVLQRDLNKDFVCENLTIVGFDFPSRTKEVTESQIYSSILDVVNLFDEKMEEVGIQERKKLFGIK